MPKITACLYSTSDLISRKEYRSKKLVMKKVWKQGKRSDSMEKSQRWSSRIIKIRDKAQGSLKNEINYKGFAIPI